MLKAARRKKTKSRGPKLGITADFSRNNASQKIIETHF